jgi:hypothetical protein
LGDEDVTAFNSTWQTLLRRVHRRFFWLDRVQIEDAIGDVIVRRLTRANKESGEACQRKPVELSVRSLYGEVCRRVGDSIRADRRRQRREWESSTRKKIWFEEDYFVHNGISAANIPVEDGLDEELNRFLTKCSPEEQAYVAVRKLGVKDMSVYAEVVGLAHCSPEQQRRAVKRVWNRIRMKWRRVKERRAKVSRSATV